CHGPITSKHPSRNDALGNCTSKSGSNEYFTPRPSHSGHIPCGLLKLNNCGLGGSNDKPQCVQAYADENGMSPSRASFRFLRFAPSLPLSLSPPPSGSEGARGRAGEGEADSAETIKFPFPSRSASSTASASRGRTSLFMTS